jgi:hypothetical protein
VAVENAISFFAVSVHRISHSDNYRAIFSLMRGLDVGGSNCLNEFLSALSVQGCQYNLGVRIGLETFATIDF